MRHSIVVSMLWRQCGVYIAASRPGPRRMLRQRGLHRADGASEVEGFDMKNLKKRRELINRLKGMGYIVKSRQTVAALERKIKAAEHGPPRPSEGCAPPHGMVYHD